MANNIWSEIRSNFEDESIVHIDAWITPDDNEEGMVIAKVNKVTGNVQYIDDRAKTDTYAQEIIKEVLADIANELLEEEFNVQGEVKESDFSKEEVNNAPIDVFLKDEGEFVTIGFQTEKAQKVLYNDDVLKKFYYVITDDNMKVNNLKGKLPKVDFPVEGLRYIKKFLTENGLTFEECLLLLIKTY